MKLYSHAAPAIRERLIRAVYAAECAKTQRDRARYFNQAYAYGDCLEIMMHSGDTTECVAPGIANRENLPNGSEAQARKYLGLNADRFLGSAEEAH